jgi:putative chitinase
MSAIWFWNKNKLNVQADAGDIKLMTKKINGGYIGLKIVSNTTMKQFIY